MKPWYDSHTITGTLLLCLSLSVHTHTLMLSTGSTGSLMSAVTRQQKHVIKQQLSIHEAMVRQPHNNRNPSVRVSLSGPHPHFDAIHRFYG
ncbi:hypothetical protein CEXT_320291 [Caerostris extrusa]|uniref:Secreted protein n=1 Tax=Caerostris extrusa TaxID=172846 RepID=A0AAV4RCY9_CAEEX|nr:hypothetical protein CEXT_320291 [Caerostris extrusa]